MRVLLFIGLLCAVQAQSPFWDYSHKFLSSWLRQGKNSGGERLGSSSNNTTPETTKMITTTTKIKTLMPTKEFTALSSDNTTRNETQAQTTPIPSTTASLTTTTQSIGTVTTEKNNSMSTTGGTSTVTEESTDFDTTTPDFTATTGEPRENPNTHEFYFKREKPQMKISSNISQNLLPLPAGASAALVKPTKYHYYPHNQHIYLLPECAIQQVCNAVYVRLNWTQPLCACPSRYRDPCSASLNSDDLHTTELTINKKSRKALTLVKTCEPTTEMRICRAPRDWSLLALQNIRTGKSHYLVICRCPDSSTLEGPMSHDQPTYASVPGIRVFGMMCVDNKRRGRPLRTTRSLEMPPFPWRKAADLAEIALWD